MRYLLPPRAALGINDIWDYAAALWERRQGARYVKNNNIYDL